MSAKEQPAVKLDVKDLVIKLNNEHTITINGTITYSGTLLKALEAQLKN